MKNFYFLIILASLITYVYFFEERAGIEKTQHNFKIEQLFDVKSLGELKRIYHKNLSLVKVGERYFVEKDFPVSQKQLDIFFDQLTSIKAKRKITKEELLEIPKELLKRDKPIELHVEFSKGALIFELGKKLDFDTTFYMRVKNTKSNEDKWIVANFENAYSHQLSKKDTHRSTAPYKQAESLFSLSENFFKEREPFVGLPPLEKLIIKSFRNRVFSVDFNKSSITPSAPKNIEVYKEKISNYKKSIEGIVAHKSERIKTISQPLGEYLLNDKFKISFYRKLNGKNGFFLARDGFAYILSSDQFRELFPPHQSFWQKKIELDNALTILDSKERVILVTTRDKRNIWTKILNSEANHISVKGNSVFKHQYIIKSGDKKLYARQDESGVSILDNSLNVIFHFLEKIK